MRNSTPLCSTPFAFLYSQYVKLLKMPRKRSASSPSSSAPARKRVQLDADAETDGDSPPPATPTPRKWGQAVGTSAKKGRFPTARLRESLAEGQYDDGTVSDSPLSSSVAVSAKPKAKVAPSVIEVSSDEEKTSKPVSKKSPTKRPQPTPVKSAASTKDGVRATPKKASAKAKVDVTVATPVKKAPAAKSSKSVVDSAHSDNEVSDDAPSLTPAKVVASSDKSPTKPAKKTRVRAKAPKSLSPVTQDEGEAEAEGDDEESPARNLKRLARARVDTTAAKPVKKPRIDTDAAESMEGVADSVASDTDTNNETHAPQSIVKREVLGSPVQLTQDRSKERSDTEELVDDEAEEESDDAQARTKDEEGSEEEAEDSFINDAVDENNQPLESQNEASDNEVQQDSDAVSVDEDRRAVGRSAVSKGKQKYTSPEPRGSSPPVTKQAPVPVKVNSNPNPNMKPECQHPDFAEYYSTLASPNLPPNVARMHPYGWMSGQRDEDVEGLDVEAVMHGCQVDELTRFRRSVTFASYQNVFQPGRVDLRQFSSECDCVRIRLDNGRGALSSVAVWLTTGVVNRSYLQFPYSPRSTGNDTRDGRTFKIVVTPSEQERHILDAVFGHLLRVRNYTGPVWESALSFQSQKPIADPQEDETPRSPRKSAFTKKKAVPIKTSTTQAGPSQAGSSQAGSSSSTGSFFQNLPPNRSFDDRIPVYDGRRCPSLSLKGFGFKERDWERLPDLPLYEQEVEEDALVTVGYTVTGWRARNANVPSVMFNALFVIVLANPTIPA
ncbi:hypothetical protein V5O48_003949 [Marasmius crinis-equi]|uniref:Uncharacterized protein n=1 Tax=Marasmius crinis-equi TaxID=585013 RepID=A0ABR3FS80_9AGAR